MAPQEQVIRWLDEHFPKPRVDPDWLQGCCEWLEGDQNISPITAFPQFMERVKEQLLESDLTDSMLCNTGLHPRINQATEKLQGPPTLVQIVAITEIGVSAFQLEQTRAAREERMQAGVGNIEGEEDGDVEVEGEGPMPKYPRGTLRFQLSDGMTIINAMEYRTIPQLTLGITELGFKLQLKGTRIQNGMALLEPATVNLLGGRYADLEANQSSDFKRGLQVRMGRSLSPEPETAEVSTQPPAALQAVRSPLREIPPPPVLDFAQQHTDDVDMEPRRRIPTTSSLNQPSVTSTSGNSHGTARPIITLPIRHTRTSSETYADDEDMEVSRRTTNAQRATLAYAASTNVNSSTESRYFDAGGKQSKGTSSSKRARDLAINAALQDLDFSFTPTPRQFLRIVPSLSCAPDRDDPANNPSFDFDFPDEPGTDENKPPPPGTGKCKKPEQRESLFLPETPPRAQAQAGDGFDDFGMFDDDFADVAYWDDVGKVLENVTVNPTANRTHPPPSASGNISTSSSSAPSSYVMVDKHVVGEGSGQSEVRRSGPTISVPFQNPTEVIEIEDSDEDMEGAEDKENQPVPTRHVRQRMNNDVSVATSTRLRETMPALSQRTGKPVVLATNPADVIDLSDSD